MRVSDFWEWYDNGDWSEPAQQPGFCLDLAKTWADMLDSGEAKLADTFKLTILFSDDYSLFDKFSEMPEETRKEIAIALRRCDKHDAGDSYGLAYYADIIDRTQVPEGAAPSGSV